MMSWPIAFHAELIANVLFNLLTMVELLFTEGFVLKRTFPWCSSICSFSLGSSNSDSSYSSLVLLFFLSIALSMSNTPTLLNHFLVPQTLQRSCLFVEFVSAILSKYNFVSCLSITLEEKYIFIALFFFYFLAKLFTKVRLTDTRLNLWLV